MPTPTENLTQSVIDFYTDYFADFADFESLSRLDRIDRMAQWAASMNDIADQIASLTLELSPNLNHTTIVRTLIRANAAVAAVLEIPEIFQAYSDGADISEQVAGAAGAVLGGYLGAELGGTIGLAIAAAIGLTPIYAGALAFGLGFGAALLLGVGLEALAENLWNYFDRRAIDPLVIDLDGDGLELTSLDESIASFDMDGDGFRELTSWVSPDDALLAIDLNGNGTIDDISELFGSETQTGYEELSAYDSNGDGVIDVQDAGFSSLLLWQDLNGNGISDDGELTTLSSAGIASIGVAATPSNFWVNGNHVIETSTVTFDDGSTTTSGEVLFNVSQVQSTYSFPEGFEYDLDALNFPFLQGVGNIPSSWVRMTEDADLLADVEGLIANARAGDFATYLNNFDDMLANWADVEDAVWRQDSGLEVFFTYDATELQALAAWNATHPDITVDGVTYPGDPYSGPTPSVEGYYFSVGGGLTVGLYEPGELEAWLEETDTLVAYHLNQSSSFWGFTITSYNSPSVSVTGSSSDGRYTVSTAVGGTELAPDMDATAFAFLQHFMGQDYRLGINYLAPGNVIVTTPEEDDVAPLIDAYSDVRDYMSVRFLAQAAWSILADEGDGADLGALAPFRNIYLDLFTDRVLGKTDDFVKELIEMFRAQGYGTDQEALELLAPFQMELPYMDALIAAEFTDIDRALITSIFASNEFVEGDAGDNVVTGNGDSILLGHGGNDTLTSNSGDTVFIGGLGDDSLTGSDNSDTYLYRTGDGNDTITDYDYGGNTGTDTLTFTDVNAADVGFSRSGNDLIITLANGETVTVVNHLDEDYDFSMEAITFADGVTLDYQDIRDRLISEMKASGTVTGTSRTENYEHTLGDGSYTITDVDPYGYTGTDTFVFTDVNSTDVTVQRLSSDPNDVVLTLANGDQITLSDELVSNNDYGVESISFADGVTWDRDDLLTAPIVDDAFVFV